MQDQPKAGVFGRASLFYGLLLLAVALTVEEGIHLFYHLQGWPPDNLTLLHHPGCTVRPEDARVLQCPVDGFNSAIFLCSETGCRFKDPSGGYRVTQSEQVILDTYMRKQPASELKRANNERK